MRGFTLVLCLVATTAAAQEPVPTIRESTRAESTPPPVPPTPVQLRYLEGLRTAGRGVAQLKDGLNRVSGYHRDSLRLKQAARRLGGLCGTARGFMTSGRGKMQATAYEDSTGVKARRLTLQIDSLIRSTPTCEARAFRQPDSTTAGLLIRLRAYEAALREFRAAIGLPPSRLVTPD
jgi:hypothetical protein